MHFSKATSQPSSQSSPEASTGRMQDAGCRMMMMMMMMINEGEEELDGAVVVDVDAV